MTMLNLISLVAISDSQYSPVNTDFKPGFDPSTFGPTLSGPADFLLVVSATFCLNIVGPLQVASLLGDSAAATMATTSVTRSQTQSLYIQWGCHSSAQLKSAWQPRKSLFGGFRSESLAWPEILLGGGTF